MWRWRWICGDRYSEGGGDGRWGTRGMDVQWSDVGSGRGGAEGDGGRRDSGGWWRWR